MNDQNKKRSENWSTEEKDILREIIAQSRHIIEDKSNKASSNIKKVQEWKNVAKKINEITGKNRTDGQVKLAWKRMKLAAKASLSCHRQHLMQTGGGEKPKSPSQEDLAIMAIAPHDFVVEFNDYDSDAIKSVVELNPPEANEITAGPSWADISPICIPPESHDVVEFVMDQVTSISTDKLSNDTTVPLLEFWKPEPNVFRRNFGGRYKHGNSLEQIGYKKNKEILRQNREKLNRRIKALEYEASTRFPHQRMVSLRPRQHYRDRAAERPVSNNPSNRDHRNKKSRLRPHYRAIGEEDEPRPIFRHTRRNRRQSTRMTPVYLMQQLDDNETTKATEEPGDTSKQIYEIPTLNPFAIKGQMENILKSFPNVNATIEVLGRTVEYNDIVMVKMTKHSDDLTSYFRAEDSKFIEEKPERKILFIVHGLTVMGMNALCSLTRELYFKTLLSYYLEYIDKFDIFLIPIANPDGYANLRVARGLMENLSPKYLWNKNMATQSACAGVVLDRNFDVAWNGSKVISSCSQLYPGPSPFSEPETKAIRDVLHHYGHRIAAYIHVHAGSAFPSVFKGEAVLYPKGYTDAQSDDDKYIDLKGEIDEAMKNASFQVMSVTVDTLHNWYGMVSGTSVDYASTVYGIPYAMEFVMQLYELNMFHLVIKESHDYAALTEIWRRVIDVTFNHIWKNIDGESMMRRHDKIKVI